MGNLFVILLFRVPLVARLVTMFLSLKFVAFLCCLGLRLYELDSGILADVDQFYPPFARSRSVAEIGSLEVV